MIYFKLSSIFVFLLCFFIFIPNYYFNKITKKEKIEKISKCKLRIFEGVDLDGAKISNIDLRGYNLRGVNFKGAHLQGANLRNADVRYANFEGAILDNAIWVNGEVCLPGFVGKCITKTAENFLKTGYCCGSNLRSVILVNETIDDAIFEYGDLSRANLSNSVFHGGSFLRCKFIQSIAINSVFCRANMTEVNMMEANFEGADLAEACFIGATMVKTILKNAVLDKANLRKVIFYKADLSDASLIRADLSDADMKYANLERTDFAYANMDGVNLTGANISGANFKGVSMKGTIWTDGRMCNFNSCNF